ncbi:MAG: GNAT family N-acetyltransferase [bacterium]|nr:GNAT family N-acetyltransferase [bacterium]
MVQKSFDIAEVKFRDFRIEDYDTLIALWRKADLGHKPKGRDRREKIAEELQRGNAHFILAEYDSVLVGSIIATQDGRKGWINRIAVDPDYRGYGLAQLLVTEAETILHEQGLDILTCLVEPENVASQKLFEKMGYVRWDGLVYYSKRRYEEV